MFNYSVRAKAEHLPSDSEAYMFVLICIKILNLNFIILILKYLHKIQNYRHDRWIKITLKNRAQKLIVIKSTII